jgi:hypothetical protein
LASGLTMFQMGEKHFFFHRSFFPLTKKDVI